MKEGAPGLTAHAERYSVGPQMATLFAGRALTFAVTFATPLILVRIFSQAEYGLYKQLFLVHETLASVLALGLVASLYYFIPNDPRHLPAYVSNTLLTLTAMGAIGLATLIVFRVRVAWLLNNPALGPYVPYVALFTEFCLVTSGLESLMVIAKRARLAAVTGLISEASRASMVITAAVWTREMQVVVVALLLWAACRVVTLVVYLQRMGIHGWWQLRREHLGAQLRYSIPFGSAVIVRTCAESVHQYVVAHLYGPGMFAIYSVGYLQIPLVGIAFESASEVALVRLTELRRDGMLDKGMELIRGTMGRLSVVLLPLYVWLALNAREVIVLLYTERFQASVPIFRIFLATIPLTALGLDYVPRAFADTGFILRVNLYRLGVNLALLAVFAGRGLVGMALATVCAMGVAKLVIWFRVRTLFGIALGQLLPWRRVMNITAASLLCGLAASVARNAVAAAPFIGLSLSAGVFGVCFGSMAWIGGFIEASEKRRVMELAGGLRRVAGRVAAMNRRSGGDV